MLLLFLAAIYVGWVGGSFTSAGAKWPGWALGTYKIFCIFEHFFSKIEHNLHKIAFSRYFDSSNRSGVQIWVCTSTFRRPQRVLKENFMIFRFFLRKMQNILQVPEPSNQDGLWALVKYFAFLSNFSRKSSTTYTRSHFPVVSMVPIDRACKSGSIYQILEGLEEYWRGRKKISKKKNRLWKISNCLERG